MDANNDSIGPSEGFFRVYREGEQTSGFAPTGWETSIRFRMERTSSTAATGTRTRPVSKFFLQCVHRSRPQRGLIPSPLSGWPQRPRTHSKRRQNAFGGDSVRRTQVTVIFSIRTCVAIWAAIPTLQPSRVMWHTGTRWRRKFIGGTDQTFTPVDRSVGGNSTATPNANILAKRPNDAGYLYRCIADTTRPQRA